MTTTTLKLTAAVRSHGGALPLVSGAIAMDGLQLDQITVEPQIAAYRRMVRDLAFDVCELAPTIFPSREHPRFSHGEEAKGAPEEGRRRPLPRSAGEGADASAHTVAGEQRLLRPALESTRFCNRY